MKKIYLIIGIVGIIVSVLLIFPIATVQADCNPGAILPPCTCSGQCYLNDFLALASRLAQYGLGLLSIVVLFFVIQGGFSLMTAMGNPEKIEAGKKLLGGTFRGVAIVLLAWAIVNTLIFFLTGNNSGLLFSGTGNPWWHFEETPLPGGCEPRAFVQEGKLMRQPQKCENTADWSEPTKKDKHCFSFGRCAGNENIICCDDM